MLIYEMRGVKNYMYLRWDGGYLRSPSTHVLCVYMCVYMCVFVLMGAIYLFLV